LEPGDKCEHAPHPNKAVQLLLKGEQRVAAFVVVDKSGGQSIMSLAGKEGFTVLVQGHALKIDKEGFAVCSANGQNSISVTNSGIHLNGNVTVGLPGIPGLTPAVATAATWATVGAQPVFNLKIGG
jgi:hypothetical protein